MFSAIGTVAVTVTGSSSRAASTVVATTAGAPAMSEVMWSMCGAGLIEMPPVSNVTPLPTSATDARGAGPPDQRSRSSRGLRDDPAPPQRRFPHRPGPAPEDAAVPACRERRVVEDLDLEPGRLAQRRGPRGEAL